MVLVAGCLFFYLNGFRFFQGPRGSWSHSPGDFNRGFFNSQMKEALGLPEEATQEQVIEALGLPADATPQQIREAMEQKGIMPRR